jgi:hypothetical protein
MTPAMFKICWMVENQKGHNNVWVGALVTSPVISTRSIIVLLFASLDSKVQHQFLSVYIAHF